MFNQVLLSEDYVFFLLSHPVVVQAKTNWYVRWPRKNFFRVDRCAQFYENLLACLVVEESTTVSLTDECVLFLFCFFLLFCQTKNKTEYFCSLIISFFLIHKKKRILLLVSGVFTRLTHSFVIQLWCMLLKKCSSILGFSTVFLLF